VERRAAGVAAPASFGQEQLWFLDRFAAGLGAYNIPLALRLAGRLDQPALSRAVDDLVARHERCGPGWSPVTPAARSS